MVWAADVPELQLSEKATELAFEIALVIQDVEFEDRTSRSPARATCRTRSPSGEEQKDAGEEISIAWDEPTVDAPVELRYIFENVKSGERKLP